MVIDEDIKRALRAAIKKHGNVLRFSRSIGVSHTTVLFWLKGRTDKINMTLWNSVVYPAISEYLNENYRENTTRLREPSVPWGTMQPQKNPEAVLLTFNDIQDLDPQIDPIEDILKKHAKNTVTFTEPILSGYFALEVDEEHAGYFHAGTRLLMAWNDFPMDNEVVLVKLHKNKQFLFGQYFRNGDHIAILRLDGNDSRLVVDRADYHNTFHWIVPLREAIQPLRFSAPLE